MLLELFFGIVLLSILVFYLRSKLKLPFCNKRRVLITGCDTGFGKQLARDLDSLGVYVYAGCLLQSSVDHLNLEGHQKLKAFCLDVRNKDSAEKAYNFVQDDLNGKALWAIVNNAGISAPLVPFDWNKVEDYISVFDVNFFGIIRTTLRFLPLVKCGGQGRIIIMSSFAGRFNTMSNPYCISKCSAEALADGLSFDLRPFNISVHTIEPGMFLTNIGRFLTDEKYFKERWNSLDPEVKKDYGTEYLYKRIAQTEKIHKMCCVSDLSLVINAYKHALFAKCPRNRYVVGAHCKVMLPLSWLPFPIVFFIMPFVRKLSGIPEPLLQFQKEL